MNLKTPIKNCLSQNIPKCNLGDSLKEVAEKIAKSESAACAVYSDNEIVGVITDTDLVDSIAQGKDLDQVRAQDLMTSCELITQGAAALPCVQLNENETIENALKVMRNGGVHHIVVWGQDGRAAGVVSAADLIKEAFRG